MPERIILKGRSEMLKPIITEILAFHQLIRDRDIGEFVGESINEAVRARPQTFKITVLYYSISTPPWRMLNSERKLVQATYNVPFVNRAKIDWQTIKDAAGGTNGYMWGRFLCTASLGDDEGNIRQMQVYGNSEAEAEERLRALASLSEGTILGLSTGEQKKVGRKAADKLLYKESTRVYPAYFTIIHKRKVITESNFPSLSGNYTRNKFRIPLWTSSKPSEADEIIREALRVRGSLPSATP